MATKLDCRPALDRSQAASLRAGDDVEISGTLVTIRDASAKRVAERRGAGEPLEVDLDGVLLYAVGPSPARPGQVVGAAGPTTTDRFVSYLPALFEAGVRGIIGKGELQPEVVPLFVRYQAIYLAAVGGLGALLAKHITAARVLLFPDLGPEAMYRFDVDEFPAVVAIDTLGTNFHREARARWRRP